MLDVLEFRISIYETSQRGQKTILTWNNASTYQQVNPSTSSNKDRESQKNLQEHNEKDYYIASEYESG